MPRITKIRISGVRYDRFRKRHENTALNLSVDELPSHTLLTLMNQGGKGVLMQLISQVILPGTRWGKNDGNKMEHMFYDQRRNLYPYTIHIVLEWRLDGPADRHLVTGICMTAFKQTADEDDESSAGLDYFTYTMEYGPEAVLSIDTLPLYDHEKKEALDYVDFKAFVKEHDRRIASYTKSQSRRSSSDYYTALKSYGIFRSEWEIMKSINKVEGGVGNYFSQAKDNKSLFDKMLIPAIVANLKSVADSEEVSLVEAFRSNLNVTRYLPVLLKREAAMISLMEGISPLVEIMDIGGRYDALIRQNRKKGHDLMAMIEAHLQAIEEGNMRWESDKKKNLEQEKFLKYKLDNVEYIRCLQEVHKLENELKVTRTAYEDNLQDLKASQDGLNRIKRDLKICKWKALSSELNMAKTNRDAWLNQMDTSMVAKLDASKEEIVRSIPYFRAYVDEKTSEFNKDLKVKKDARVSLNRAMQTLRDDMIPHLAVIENTKQIQASLKKEEEKLTEFFSPFELIMPTDLVVDVQKQWDESQKILHTHENTLGKLQADKRNKGFERKELELKFKHESEKLKDVKEKYDKRFKFEKQVVEDACKLLGLDPHGKVYSKAWADKTKDALKALKESKRIKQQDIYERLWRQKINQNLNQGPFWIPNEDVLGLKKTIQSQGISLMLGSEFLSGLEFDEREALLKSYPDLAYGLILEREETLGRLMEVVGMNDLLHNPVPIFIRQRMGFLDASTGIDRIEEPPVRHYLKNMGDLLVLDEGAFLSWKEDLKKKIGELSSVIDVIETAIDRIDIHIRDICQLDQSPSASDLGKILHDQEERITSLKDQMIRFEENVQILEDQINNCDQKISQAKQALEQVTFKLGKLESYVVKYEAYQEAEAKSRVAGEKLAILEKELNQKRLIDQGLAVEIDRLDQDYKGWKDRIDKCKDKVERWVDFKENNAEDEKGTLEFDLEAFENTLSIHRRLMQSVEDSQKPLMDMEAQIEDLAKKLQEIEECLIEIDETWKAHIGEPLSESRLENEKILLSEKVDKLKEHDHEYKSQVDIIKVRVEEKYKEAKRRESAIERDHNPYRAQWQDDVHVESQVALIKKQQADVEAFLLKVDEAIRDLRSDHDDMQSYKVQLSRYNLEGRMGTPDKMKMSSFKQVIPDEVANWVKTDEDLSRKRDEKVSQGKQSLEKLRKILDQAETDSMLHERLKTILMDMEIENFITNKETFESIKNHFQKEVHGLKKDKERAEDIQQKWSVRAARYIMQIVHSLQDMVHQMVYTNERDYDFPLVRLKGEERLPTSEDELIHLMKMLFAESVEKLLEYEDVDEIPESLFRQLMSDAKLFSYGLRGHYPVLEVYKMTEANEFKHYQPREEFYSSWESINKGGQDDPEGSGGQTLSVNTFVMMMLMSHQKRYVRRENTWTFLMMDNPFGKASAKHILDPVFEIADSLNFQLLCFAPPELIKTEISERFPVFWALEISEKVDARGEVTGHVRHGGRRWKG